MKEDCIDGLQAGILADSLLPGRVEKTKMGERILHATGKNACIEEGADRVRYLCRQNTLWTTIKRKNHSVEDGEAGWGLRA